MKLLYYKLLIIIISVLGISCSNDLGNYDYKEIEEITIKNSRDTVYNVLTKTGVLSIVPDIRINTGTFNPDDYTYVWEVVPGATIMGKEKIGVISNEKDLNYEMTLPVNMEGYVAVFRMQNKKTKVSYTATWPFFVTNLYSSGLMAWCEKQDGYARLDFISTVNDTVVITDIMANTGFPALKGPNLVFQGSYFRYYEVHLSSDDGTYLIDPSTMAYNEKTDNFSYKILAKEVIKSSKIDYLFDPRNHRMAVIDGQMCWCQMFEGAVYGYPVNRYVDSTELIKIAPEFACNYKLSYYQNKIYVMYDMKNKWFCANSQIGYLYPFPNNTGYESGKLEDVSSDVDIFKWETGLDYVATFYSFYVTGYSYTILKDDKGKYYLYVYEITSRGPKKHGRYDISDAQEIEKATNPRLFFASSTQPYIFYAAGGKIYAYDYETGKKSKMVVDLKDEITAIYDCPTKEPGMNNFYVATYNGQVNGGVIRKMHIVNNPNLIEIEMIKDENNNELIWRGFEKVKSMWDKMQ